MKMTKRIFSLALCLVLMMALALPAFAAGTTYTLTINNENPNHVYQAYQLFKGDLAEKDGKQILSNITWGSAVSDPAGLLAKINTTVGLEVLYGATDAANLAVKLSAVTSDSATIDLFTETVAPYLTTVAGTSGAQAGNQYTISGLEAGYYLIKDKPDSLDGVFDVYTRFILRVLKSLEVTPKGEVPDVDKTVNDTIDGTFGEHEDGDIGDTLYYKWEGKLPSNLKDYEGYYYEFQDTLSAGLKFLRIEQIYVESSEGVQVHVFYTANSDPKVKPDPSATLLSVTDDKGNADPSDDVINTITQVTSDQSVVLKFSDLQKLYTSLLPTHKIIVKYSAQITRDAVFATAMPNSVKLIFSNDPQGDGTGTTPEDEAYAFTFKIDVDKYDADDKSKKLEGAEFNLYYERTENVGGKDTIVKYYAKVVTEEMVYVVDSDGKVTTTLRPEGERMLNGTALDGDDVGVVYGWTTSLSEASILDTDKDGKLSVKGLDAGIFYLKETKAPTGYNLMETPVQIKIVPTYSADGKTVNVSYEVDSIEQTTTTVGVRNSSGSTLPITGGVGTTMFYVIGGILVAAAVVMLISRRRVEE